jgi:hypothetical protein
MAITAQYIDDDDFAEELVKTATGMRGVRYYKCNTRIRELAFEANGLPLLGDSWSARHPELRATQYENPVYVGGKVNATNEDGHCFVPVVYTTGEPVDGDVWTEIGGSIETFQRYFPINPTASEAPIANGDGVSVEVGLATLTVVKLYKPDERETLGPLIQRMYELKFLQAVSEEGMSLPPLRFTEISINVEAGMLRFHDFSVNTEAGLVEVRITMKVAPDHDFRWQPVIGDGTASNSPPQVAVVYERRSFAGLW